MIQEPPKWAPNAIPTARGWTHPKTGEILIARRGLKVEEDIQESTKKPEEEDIQESTKKPEEDFAIKSKMRNKKKIES